LSIFYTMPPTTSIYTLSLHDALPISKSEYLKSMLERQLTHYMSCNRRAVHDLIVSNRELISPILFAGLLSCFTGNVYSVSKLVLDRKSTRLNSSHVSISYAVFCLKKK